MAPLTEIHFPVQSDLQGKLSTVWYLLSHGDRRQRLEFLAPRHLGDVLQSPECGLQTICT